MYIITVEEKNVSACTHMRAHARTHVEARLQHQTEMWVLCNQQNTVVQ